MQIITLMVWVLRFSSIPTNNNQLSIGAGYIAASALNSYALTSQIPTNNNQLTNDASYITAATLPTVSSGNITYQGTGEIKGGGTSNANQNNSTLFNFDLTSQTKTNISNGLIVYNWG